MEKLVIKITVYKDVDPVLYDSVSQLPLRQRAAVIRRLWQEGLWARSQGMEASRPADTQGAPSTINTPGPKCDPHGPHAPTADSDSVQKRVGDDIAALMGSTWLAT